MKAKGGRKFLESARDGANVTRVGKAETYRIFVVDDHPAIRSGIAAMIDEDPTLKVVGQAGNVKDALRLVDTIDFDLLITDIEFPEGDGFSIAEHLLAKRPSTAVCFMTMHRDWSHLGRAIQLGARGFLNKDIGPASLRGAVQSIRDGKEIYPPEAAALVGGSRITGLSEKARSLTPGEVSVLRMVGQGFVSKEIAAALDMNVRTVERYRSNIIQKLGLRSAADLVRAALELNF